VRDAEVVADLGDLNGRRTAIDRVTELAADAIDGLVTCAGIGGLSDRPGAPVVSVNYFGTVVLLESLRPLLAQAERPAAVAISSNSTTCQPRVPMKVVELCLAGDETAAREAADAAGSLAAYAASKLAVAWWVRRHATRLEGAGAGIALNAVAPGAVETPLLQASRHDAVFGKLIDEFPVPVGRKGEPDEIAAFVQFLLSHARFICGAVVFVDGGTDAQLRSDDFPWPMSTS
jgi:NAD(P)-dependent dehydrogenase (short-subunit alcohol dehydrogenase family)